MTWKMIVYKWNHFSRLKINDGLREEVRRMEQKYPIKFKESADIRNAVKYNGHTLKWVHLVGHRRKKIKKKVMSHKP
jgi:hypothetical protein